MRELCTYEMTVGFCVCFQLLSACFAIVFGAVETGYSEIIRDINVHLFLFKLSLCAIALCVSEPILPSQKFLGGKRGWRRGGGALSVSLCK